MSEGCTKIEADEAGILGLAQKSGPKMKVLMIGGWLGVSDTVLDGIAFACPNLRKLSVSSTEVTDVGLIQAVSKG